MFQLGLGEVIQAEREREMAELIRQRRLLQPHEDGRHPDEFAEHRADKPAPRVRSQATGS